MSRTYRTVDAPVEGGTLHAGVWEPADGGARAAGPDAPTVLAIHGVTAHHLAFAALADELPGVRLVAPDLRGRGRSRTIPGPYGMPRHADDVAALAARTGVRRAVVVGHSMGAFAALVLAHRHPGLVERLVLVDGGIPIPLPEGVDPDVAMGALLGPAAERLRMTFDDVAAYRAFWREHPAFAHDWSPALERYFDHDLHRVPGGLQPAARVEALEQDQRELLDGGSVLRALDELAVPTTLLRAPAGLLAGPPLYEPAHLRAWAERLPVRLDVVDVPDVNHYTVVMAPHGARVVARYVNSAPGPGSTEVTVSAEVSG